MNIEQSNVYIYYNFATDRGEIVYIIWVSIL